MKHPCYRLFPNIKQPIPHLVSIIPVRPLLQSSHYSVLPVGQSHLRKQRDVLAGPSFCSIQSSNNVKQSCSPVHNFFEVEMAVRDCEVDKYGVVANAIYANYIDIGTSLLISREVAARNLGINLDSIAESGRALATSELHLKYFAPIRGGSKFVVKSRLIKIKGVRLFFEHVIETLPDHKIVLKATAITVCLNEEYRPTCVFPELSKNLKHLLSDDTNLS